MSFELLTLLMMNFPIDRNDYVICTFDKELTPNSKVYILAPTRDPNLPTCAGNMRELGVVGPLIWQRDRLIEEEGISSREYAERWIINANDNRGNDNRRNITPRYTIRYNP